MAALDRESELEERLALVEGLTVSPLRRRQRSISAPRARPEPPAAFSVRSHRPTHRRLCHDTLCEPLALCSVWPCAVSD